MIHFFVNASQTVYTVQTPNEISSDDIQKLNWLFGKAQKINKTSINKTFVGPRAAMVTPWSTNAVEITQNMGVQGIVRIEEFQEVAAGFSDFDPMLSQKYQSLEQDIFEINVEPEPILEIE